MVEYSIQHSSFTFKLPSLKISGDILNLMGKEAINYPYHYNVIVKVLGEVNIQAWQQQNVELYLQNAAGDERILGGIINRVRLLHEGRREDVHYEFRMVSPLWYLSKQSHNRLFRQVNRLTLVQQLLHESYQGALILNIDDVRPVLMKMEPLIQQYQEDNLSFMTRLLQSVGVNYLVSYDDSQYKLRFFSTLSQLPVKVVNISPIHRGEASPQASEHSVLLSKQHQVIDYKPTNPHSTYTARSLFSQPAEIAESTCLVSTSHVIYPGEISTQSEGELRVQQASDNARQKLDRVTGHSTALGLAPGMIVHQGGDTLTPVAQVTHTLASSMTASSESGRHYENRFTGIGAELDFKPGYGDDIKVVGLQRGYIAAEEGSVKSNLLSSVPVKLTWHGEDDYIPNARVGQLLSGVNYGSQFIPRGQDSVFVSFGHGLLNRPMITGSRHTVSQPATYDAAEEPHRIGIKSQLLNGDRGHELTFDDTDSAETLKIVAQGAYKTEAGAAAGIDVTDDEGIQTQQSNEVSSQTYRLQSNAPISLSGGSSQVQIQPDKVVIHGATFTFTQSDIDEIYHTAFGIALSTSSIGGEKTLAEVLDTVESASGKVYKWTFKQGKPLYSHRATLKGVDTGTLSYAEKGTLGEMRTALAMQKAGFEELPAKLPKNNGFDGVWVKRDASGKVVDIIISESKFAASGRGKLSETMNMGRQMDDKWIRLNIENMVYADDPEISKVGTFLSDNFDLIRKKVAVIDKYGMQKFNKLKVR